MKSDFLLKVACCWNLETLDLAGDTNLDDNAISNLSKGEIKFSDDGPA